MTSEDALARGLAALGLEDLPQRRRDETALGGPAVGVHVAHEVHRAALPRTPEHPLDRRLEALVVVGDRQAHSGQAASSQGAQELDPEAARLHLAEVESDHLPAARLVDRVGDHERLRAHVAVRADLDVLGVEPQVGIVALERPRAEGRDLVVESPTHRRDAVLRHALDAELLDEAIDLARGDAVYVGLEDDRRSPALSACAARGKRESRPRPGAF